jgi:hypothetical protein
MDSNPCLSAQAIKAYASDRATGTGVINDLPVAKASTYIAQHNAERREQTSIP